MNCPHGQLARQCPVCERDAEIAALRCKIDMLLAEEPAAERTLDAIDAAALELTGPWPAGTCSREAAIALPENYRKLVAEIARLREVLGDWAKMLREIGKLKQRNEQLSRALRNIIQHQQIVGGSASQHSATVAIARAALAKEE